MHLPAGLFCLLPAQIRSFPEAVKKGDPVVVLEIMKMETPVVAPQDGTVASVDVAKGETVESGAVLATMNA